MSRRGYITLRTSCIIWPPASSLVVSVSLYLSLVASRSTRSLVSMVSSRSTVARYRSWLLAHYLHTMC